MMTEELDLDQLIEAMDEIGRLETNIEKLIGDQIYIKKLLDATGKLGFASEEIHTASRVHLHYLKTGDFYKATPNLEHLLSSPYSYVKEELVVSLEASVAVMKEKMAEWFKKLVDMINSLIAYNRILERKLHKLLSDGKLSDIRSLNVQAYKSITVPFFQKDTFSSVVKTLAAVNYKTVIQDKEGTFKEIVDPSVVEALAKVGQVIKDKGYEYDKSKVETNKPISALGWSIDDLVPQAKDLAALINSNATGGRRAVSFLKKSAKQLKDDNDLIAMKHKVNATKDIYMIIQRTAIMLTKLFMQLVKRLKK